MLNFSPRKSVVPLWFATGNILGFGIGGSAGALFALTGPLNIIRVLGLIAFGLGMIGFVLHVLVLRHQHPSYWAIRWGTLRQSISVARTSIVNRVDEIAMLAREGFPTSLGLPVRS